MDALAGVIGFILGVILFVVIYKKLSLIFASFRTLAFLFFISLVLGVIIAKVFLWLAIIGAVVGAILWLFLPDKKEEEEPVGEEVNAEATPKDEQEFTENDSYQTNNPEEKTTDNIGNQPYKREES